MLRPITTTLRLNITAASIACWIRDTLDANVAKTTRPFASPTACLIAGPTELSEPVVPGFQTFVESDIKANTPLLPSSANFVHIHQTAINWRLVDFKVPCMKYRTDWCIEVHSAGVRDGVVCLDETNIYRTNLNFIACSNRAKTFWRYLMFFELTFNQATNKVCCIILGS